MEIIYKCIDVIVKVNGQSTYHSNVNSNREEEEEMASLHSSIDRFYAPTESVPLELTITFDNRSGERTMYAYTLLTLLGVHSFQDLWKLLFDQLIVTPYLSPINDKPKNVPCLIENNNNNNSDIVNSTAELLNISSMIKENRQKSTFCYGVPTWLHTLRQNVNKQQQEYATSVSDSMLTNKKKENDEVSESNRLVEEIHAMLEGNDRSVIDEASNENMNINCSIPTPEVRSVSVLSSPFAIVVDSVQWHHIEPESSEVQNASTSVQTSQHAENNNTNYYRNSVNSGSDKVDCSSTIPTFVQYTYKFHVTLPEIQCNKVLANMRNAETNIIVSSNNDNDENNKNYYYSGKDNNSEGTLENYEKTLQLLLMLQTPLKLNCSVNTSTNYNISDRSNYDSTIFHVEAIRRVLSNSVNNNKYNRLPMGCGSIPISIHRPLFVNHIACSLLRSNAFLLSCTVQNELLSSSYKSLSQSTLVLSLYDAEIDLRTTQRVSCTQLHHDAMKRELLKRFTTFSKSVIDHKKKMRISKKKNLSKSNWSKVVNQYNEEINISYQQEATTSANLKNKSITADKIGQGKDESKEELQSTNSIKEKIMSLTSRWGVEYKDETILSICNDCINVIPLSAETASLPLELHPRETYSFQFMLELRPEVSYWLTQYADYILHSQITETVHTNKIVSKTLKPVTQASTTTLINAKKVIQEQQNPLQLLPQQSQSNEHNNLLVKRVDETNTNVQPHRSTSTPFAPLHILDKAYNATDVIDALSQIYTTNLYLSYALRQVDRNDDQLHNQTQNDNLCKQCQILHLTQPIT